jgi:hypothetical protein
MHASLYLMLLWQILNPNPEAMSKLITENASEEFLHSLSNYCAFFFSVSREFSREFSRSFSRENNLKKIRD